MASKRGSGWPVGLYRAVESAIAAGRYAGRIGYAVHQAIWLGVLDRHARSAITDGWYSRDKTRYQNEDYNRGGLKRWEEAVVDRYFARCKRVIVGGAGGGREAFALAQRGIAVDAFECVPRLVSTAQEVLRGAAAPTRVIWAAPDDVPELGMHDGAICGWGAYMHIAGSVNRVRFLRKLRAQLEIGSPLLVSFHPRSGDSRELRFIAALGSLVRKLRRSEEQVEVGDQMRGWYFHRFNRNDIEREFEAAGFRLDLYAEEYTDGYAVGIAV